MPPKVLIDTDIARARTLPAAVYRDPAYYALQKERVFAPSWQYVGDARRLKAPGHVLPFTLLEGCLDEPLVLTRDKEGELRCLSNVCTHRGTIVVEGEGHLNSLRCRYHGRRFGLDGCMQFMPEFDDVEGFPSERDDLPRVRLESWGPFLFASLDPAVPFDEWIEPMRSRVGFLPLDRFVHDATTSHDYLIQANWALYNDNYLEGFHIPYVHAALSEVLDYGNYRTEIFDWQNLQLGVGKQGEDLFALPAGHPDEGTPVAAYYFWLYPNLMFNFYPWGLSINIVQPLGVDRTKVSFQTFVWKDELRRKGGGYDIHRVEMEDEEVVEAVQRGVRSRLYDRGRYSVTREAGTHHFHRLLAEGMGGTE